MKKEKETLEVLGGIYKLLWWITVMVVVIVLSLLWG